MMARYAFEARPEFANPTGAIQGGFIAAMLDEAMSTTAIIASNVTMNAPTLEMKISFLRPLFVGKATAEARILKWGKSTCFIEAELFDPEGEAGRKGQRHAGAEAVQAVLIQPAISTVRADCASVQRHAARFVHSSGR